MPRNILLVPKIAREVPKDEFLGWRSFFWKWKETFKNTKEWFFDKCLYGKRKTVKQFNYKCEQNVSNKLNDWFSQNVIWFLIVNGEKPLIQAMAQSFKAIEFEEYFYTSVSFILFLTLVYLDDFLTSLFLLSIEHE